MIYKMQIPPFPVKSFDLLTTRQAKEMFKWYTDDIPARLDQLQKCIDADVNGTVQLTRGLIDRNGCSNLSGRSIRSRVSSDILGIFY